MSNIIEIVDKSEFEKVIQGKEPVLVDFFAVWCGPCKMQSPILKEFAQEVGEKVKVVKVDVDINAELAMEYGVSSIPTLAVFSCP